MKAGGRRASTPAPPGGRRVAVLAGACRDEEIELAGSAVGLVPPGRQPILGADLAPGDEIVFVASAGLHANGSSLARRVAGGCRTGYRTPLPSGRTFGEALLDRTAMYAALVRALLAGEADEVHYLSHITGHGLLKLMRPRRELTYRWRGCRRSPRYSSSWSARTAVGRRRLLDVQHGLRLRRLLRAGVGRGRGPDRCRARDCRRGGGRRGGRARGGSCWNSLGSSLRAATRPGAPPRRLSTATYQLGPLADRPLEARRRRHRREVLGRHRVDSQGHERCHEVVHRRRREHEV